jgi:uncharacterized protein (UPF0333 family)
MIRHKKAQTSTEYLIILAVVIVIALIVVGVMGGIPSLGGSDDENVDENPKCLDAIVENSEMNKKITSIIEQLPNNSGVSYKISDDIKPETSINGDEVICKVFYDVCFDKNINTTSVKVCQIISLELEI